MSQGNIKMPSQSSSNSINIKINFLKQKVIVPYSIDKGLTIQDLKNKIQEFNGVDEKMKLMCNGTFMKGMMIIKDIQNIEDAVIICLSD